MFKLSLFNVLNGQRFACSEMKALGNVSLVLWIAGKSSWFKKIQRLRPGLAGIINSPWVKSDTFSALFAYFFRGVGGAELRKNTRSVPMILRQHHETAKNMLTRKILTFRMCFFFCRGGGQGGAKNARSLLFERLCSIDHLNLWMQRGSFWRIFACLKWKWNMWIFCPRGAQEKFGTHSVQPTDQANWFLKLKGQIILHARSAACCLVCLL